jgi:ethanolamine utilization protein EutA
VSQDLRFSSADRFIGEEDEIELVSVGIDIGSSTSHLLFSSIRLERRGDRYQTVERRVVRESDIILTPFTGAEGEDIDRVALGAFVDREYAAAGLDRAEIDTGALILTGLAARRDNAREIGEVLADDAGRFVTVSAGDGLEATMAAFGSGAVAHSEDDGATLVVDMGGGTTKFAVCEGGAVRGVTALDVGARLVLLDEDRRVVRIEPAGAYFGDEAGVVLEVGRQLSEAEVGALVERMVDAVLDVASGDAERMPRWSGLLRLPPLQQRLTALSAVFLSGGVSAFLSDQGKDTYGDLGPELAQAVARRLAELGAPVRHGSGIRATVMGASQHTVQVSGSTIFVDPVELLPLTNVPVVTPQLDLTQELIEPAVIAERIRADLDRLEVGVESPVAVAVHFGGSATYSRLSLFCQGLLDGLAELVAAGQPVVLVSDGDLGGLLGMQLRGVAADETGVVSVDGIELKEFDFIDIGEILTGSGAVPVVIKSLVFPKGELKSLPGISVEATRSAVL